MLNLLQPSGEASWRATGQHFVGPVLRWCGIDRAIAYTLIGRGWSVFAGPITLFLIARFMRPDQQGFYYTFGSILGLNIFFELGLTYVLLQFASHESAHLEWTSAGTLTGSPHAKERLAALLKFAMRWYAVAGLLCIAVILPTGLLFFSRNSPKTTDFAWTAPWIWLTVSSALSLCVGPLFAILEGCGKVSRVASMRVQQSILANLGLWIALLCHGGLFASPIFQTINVIFALSWVAVHYRPFFLDLVSVQWEHIPLHWWKEVWPFQWRIAVSWLSGYFIFQLFNPVLFRTRGPVEAGRMGMSLYLCTALLNVAIAWMSTKASPFGVLVAGRRYRELDKLFFRTLRQSFTVVVAGAAAVYATVIVMRHYRNPLASRLLDPLPLVMLLCCTIINHLVFCEAQYLRAHKMEPFLLLSVIGAIITSFSIYFLAGPYGAPGLCAGYLASSILGLALATSIFLRRRKEWHSNAGQDLPV